MRRSAFAWKRAVTVTFALLLLALNVQGVIAQTDSPATEVQAGGKISFTFDRAREAVPHYVIEVAEDGRGTYTAEVVSSRGSDAPAAVTVPLELSDRTTKLIFASARALFPGGHLGNGASTTCGLPGKNLADTGTKTLRSIGAEGDRSCTYNQPGSREVLVLTNVFQGMAETLAAGRRLEFDRRFDRLALDAEMSTLVEDVAQGRAVEPGLIGRTLRSIARDTEVMERVRQKAAGLLQRATSAD